MHLIAYVSLLRKRKAITKTPGKSIFLAMKLAAIFCIIGCLGANAHGLGQKITLVERNAPMKDVLHKIEQQSGYQFLFFDNDLKLAGNITIRAKNASLPEVLQRCFKDQPLSYEIVDRTVVIKIRDVSSQQQPTTGPPVLPEPPVLVHGQVVDSLGRPLSGVSVSVKGTRNGTSTGADGRYAFNVSNGKILVFTSVGYQTRELPIDGKEEINITLFLLEQSMDEVTIVSYGTQRRAAVTGSISTVKASSVADLPVGQFTQKLQGQVAGMNVNINTGKPGQGMAIQIRGAVSINAGNYPLVVVDGQPLTPNGGANPINNINPDEIESYTILKDASATALYGSRAASGVLLITTKSARAGKTTVDFNAYYGLASLDKSHMPKMMNANQLATFMNEFFQDKIANEGWVNPTTGTATVPSVYADPSQYGKGTDWLGRIMRTAPTQNYSLTFSDAREKSSTTVVAGYFDQKGIVKNTDYHRFSVRVNNEFRPTSYLKIGLDVAPSQQVDHNSQGGPTDGIRTIVEGSLLSSPIAKSHNPDGALADTASTYYLLQEPSFEKVAVNQHNVYTTTRLMANTYIQLTPVKGLVLKTAADIDVQGQTQEGFVNQYAAGSFNNPTPAPISQVNGSYATDNYTSWVSENTATYTTSLGDHHIEALAGYTAQKYSDHTSKASGTNYADASIPYISSAGTTSGTSGLTEWALISTIGRLNYNYKGKYLLSGAIRRDGSSKFGAAEQYGTFPSISGGWVASDEPFMQNMRAINFLKLRASYGLTGNNNFNSGNYPAISLVSPINYVMGGTLVGGRYVSQLGNTILTWEKNKQTDLGLDISLLDNRLQFTYDYYYKLTDGLLYQVNIPQSSGFNSVASNIGTFKFWGHEFTVNSRNLVGKLSWSTSLNVTFNRNRIMKLGTQNLPIMPPEEYDYPNIQQVGKPIGMFYGYVNDGVYKDQQEYNSQPHEVVGGEYVSGPGTVRMKDVNGDGVINSDDRTIIGNPNPKFVYGITNTFRYGKFDLGIVISGTYGNQIEDERAQSAANLDGAFNMYASQLDHWRSPSDPGNGLVPSTLAGTTAFYRTVQSLWVHSGSALTCRNITLGYDLGMKNKYISRLRAYFSVQQAFVITKYPGFSPETNSQGTANLNGLDIGVDNTEYPIPRTLTLGINMGLF